MKNANIKVKANLKMFSCPFQSYCGSQDLETIVPEYNGRVRNFRKDKYTLDFNSKKQFEFKKGMVCRHQLKFPMDARSGDKIKLDVEYLYNAEIILALSKGFDDKKI